jgi:hypothetical protein
MELGGQLHTLTHSAHWTRGCAGLGAQMTLWKSEESFAYVMSRILIPRISNPEPITILIELCQLQTYLHPYFRILGLSYWVLCCANWPL